MHHVTALSGHASISTTGTGLNASLIHLRESMLEMVTGGESDTNVPQHTATQPDQGVHERSRVSGKSLRH